MNVKVPFEDYRRLEDKYIALKEHLKKIIELLQQNKKIEAYEYVVKEKLIEWD